MQKSPAAIIFDCETTGFNEPRIVEAAYYYADFKDEKLTFFDSYYGQYNPEKPIELGALNTHHILDCELEALPSYKSFSLPPAHYVIGHNIDFDLDVMGNPPDIKRICTLAICRKLYPEAESHALGAMMYHIFGRVPTTRDMLKNAHNAQADCLLAGLVLRHCAERLGITTLEALHAYSEEAKLSTAKFYFGKYKGMLISEVVQQDAKYLQWVLRETDQPEAVKKLISQILMQHAKEKCNA